MPSTLNPATTNGNDGIYRDSMLLKLTKESDGYLGTIILAADSNQNNI